MPLKKSEAAFSELGDYLKRQLEQPDEAFLSVLQKAELQNPWFTRDNIFLALSHWADLLQPEPLSEWLAPYPNRLLNDKKVALVMAGNLPLVGFHDLLCVLVSGCKAIVKPSGKDEVLTSFIIAKLKAFNPEWETRITLEKHTLKDFDAVIATGSNNTSRYFEYYFKNKPHIIRKGRTSAAIINGDESEEELKALAKDIFQYFGLGCRNVSKIYVPEGYDFTLLMQAFQSFDYLSNHFKYSNNYHYHKSVYLLNGDEFLDGGFYLLKKAAATASPLSVVFYDDYQHRSQVENELEAAKEQLQCIVGKCQALGEIPFGHTQIPALDQYADHINTLDFLEKITNKNFMF